MSEIYIELLIQDDDTLADWFCIMNLWGWPPLPYNENFRILIMTWILKHVGRKRVYKKWNQHYIREPMSDEKFEEWWLTVQDYES